MRVMFTDNNNNDNDGDDLSAAKVTPVAISNIVIGYPETVTVSLRDQLNINLQVQTPATLYGCSQGRFGIHCAHTTF